MNRNTIVHVIHAVSSQLSKVAERNVSTVTEINNLILSPHYNVKTASSNIYTLECVFINKNAVSLLTEGQNGEENIRYFFYDNLQPDKLGDLSEEPPLKQARITYVLPLSLSSSRGSTATSCPPKGNNRQTDGLSVKI